MPRHVVALLDNEQGLKMVKDMCKARGFRFNEFEELIKAEADQAGKIRKRLSSSFDDILDRIQIDD